MGKTHDSNGIWQKSLVSLAESSLGTTRGTIKLELNHDAIITAFIIATTMCVFHLLRQTAITGIFWYRVSIAIEILVKNHSIAIATDVERAKV